MDVPQEDPQYATDEILANAGHGLRTPINSILTISEILQEELYGPLTGRQAQALQQLDTNARQLLRLIDDLLDLLRIETGQLPLQLEPVPLDIICQASLLSVRELAHSSQARLTCTTNCEGAMLRTDPKRLKQMLVWLLRAAVEIAPAGGTVTLMVTVLPEQQLICFTARHRGNHTEIAELPKHRRPVTLLDLNLESHSEETRLGLMLVKRLAVWQGGDVQVESTDVPYPCRCLSMCLPYRV